MNVIPLTLVAAQAMFQPSDPRIQTITYSPGQVVTLSVAQGYATVVELVPEERVDTVVVGNSPGWQVTASRSGDRIIVKPLGGATTTNLVVITDVRRYTFLLQPSEGNFGTPFVMRFVLQSNVSADGLASQQTGSYRFSGDKALFPAEMTSDGQRTRVRWKPDQPVPAIFESDGHGKDMLINGRMVGELYVIEGVATRYTFRSGKRRAIARLLPSERAQ